MRDSSSSALAFSIGAHAAFVALLAMTPTDVWRANAVDNYITTALRYLLPPLPESSSASGEQVYYVARGGDAAGRVVDPTTNGESPTLAIPVAVALRGDNGADDHTAISLAQAATEQSALTVEEVDSTAVRDPSSAGPDYPPVPRERNVEGYASLRFVVDTTGLIDLASVEVIEATHPEFARAVRDAMPRMHFRPARFGAIALRQISVQRFSFRLEPAVSGTATAKKKSP